MIELLIVIGIIAILAAAIIIAVAPGDQMERAQRASVESQMQSIGTAVHNVVLDMGNDINTLSDAVEECIADDGTDDYVAVIGGDDVTGADYGWKIPSSLNPPETENFSVWEETGTNDWKEEIEGGGESGSGFSHDGCLGALELPAMTHPVNASYDYAIVRDGGRITVLDLSETMDPMSY